MGRPIQFCFDRKEVKDHGEGGQLIGAELGKDAKVVIVEDVLSAGTSLRHTLSLLQQKPCELLGAIVGLDRQENGTGNTLAAAEMEANGLRVAALSNVELMVERLHGQELAGRVWIDDDMRQKIDAYRSQFTG